jgi:transposase
MAFRAEVILAIAEGLSNKAVAERLDTRPATVIKWRGRFAQAGFAGLLDASRSGKPRQYQGEHERRILAALDEPPPTGYGRWDGSLLARHLGDISKHQIWRVLRRPEISLARRRSWCISTDPAFAQKGSRHCRALPAAARERGGVFGRREAAHPGSGARPRLVELPDGKAVTGFSHAYNRHGTTTLFAALDVATGLVKTGHYQRRRRVEFLDFMNRLGGRPCRSRDPCDFGQSQYTQAQTRPLAGSAQEVHFHFTPTHASWLNEVEVWFSILAAKALAGASFTSPRQVRDQIDAFITAYNQTPHPFEWTKQVVFSQHPRAKYADLCNSVLEQERSLASAVQ